MRFSLLTIALLGLAATVLLSRRRASRAVPFDADVPFTPDARAIVERAQDEARALRHDYVGTEHLLLALTNDAHVGAREELTRAGISPPFLRADVLRRITAGRTLKDEELPYTSRAWTALKHAVSAAAESRQSATGVRELMIGLVREQQGTAAMTLRDAGVTELSLR